MLFSFLFCWVVFQFVGVKGCLSLSFFAAWPDTTKIKKIREQKTGTLSTKNALNKMDPSIKRFFSNLILNLHHPLDIRISRFLFRLHLVCVDPRGFVVKALEKKGGQQHFFFFFFGNLRIRMCTTLTWKKL